MVLVLPPFAFQFQATYVLPLKFVSPPFEATVNPPSALPVPAINPVKFAVLSVFALVTNNLLVPLVFLNYQKNGLDE